MTSMDSRKSEPLRRESWALMQTTRRDAIGLLAIPPADSSAAPNSFLFIENVYDEDDGGDGDGDGDGDGEGDEVASQ